MVIFVDIYSSSDCQKEKKNKTKQKPTDIFIYN